MLDHLLCLILLLLIGDVHLLVFIDDLQVHRIVGELLVMTRSHELDGLIEGSMNSVHGRADCLSKASAYILILRLVRMNANRSKDILNLDIVFNYDCNSLNFLPFFWILNVFELNLVIKLPHAGLKSCQDVLFHQLLHL